MILRRTDKGEYAKSIFFHEYNEIDIFVEDTSLGYKKIYTQLLQRVLDDKYKIHSIFPLGGRESVINYCKNHNRPDRPFVFIVDADLYLMKGEDEDLSTIKGLFILTRYCIENYLIEINALVELLHEEDIEKNKEEIIDLLSYDDWLRRNEPLLLDLFIEYAVAFSLVPEIKTISYGVSKLILSQDGDICTSKVTKRIQSIKKEIIQITGETLYQEMREYICSSISSDECMLLKYVSAKDYIIPLIFLRMRSRFNLKSKNINWKVRLSMKCDISPLEGVNHYITTI